jgi:peptidoglycan/LPS O-acetylase OafA/YrhL
MNLLVVAAVLVATIPISWVTFVLWERPLMRLGRKFGRKLLEFDEARRPPEPARGTPQSGQTKPAPTGTDKVLIR